MATISRHRVVFAPTMSIYFDEKNCRVLPSSGTSSWETDVDGEKTARRSILRDSSSFDRETCDNTVASSKKLNVNGEARQLPLSDPEHQAIVERRAQFLDKMPNIAFGQRFRLV